MWRHVCLDFGGTLAREVSGRHEIYADAGRRAGIDVSPERMHELMARTHDELPARIPGAWRYDDAWFRAYMQRIFCDELGLPHDALPALASELFSRFSDPHTFRLLPGALELLEALRRARLSVAIVSNWSTALPRLVDGLGLGPFVAVVVASALEGVEKPDPEIFARALERSGATAATSVHAGDRYELDCLGARAAGIEPILVQHAGSPPVPAADESLLCVASLFELRDTILERHA